MDPLLLLAFCCMALFGVALVCCGCVALGALMVYGALRGFPGAQALLEGVFTRRSTSALSSSPLTMVATPFEDEDAPPPPPPAIPPLDYEDVSEFLDGEVWNLENEELLEAWDRKKQDMVGAANPVDRWMES